MAAGEECLPVPASHSPLTAITVHEGEDRV